MGVSTLELRGVHAALYLAQCPHALPASAGQWLSAWLGHWQALPIGTSSMVIQCLHHAICHRGENVRVGVLRAVIMLLTMPMLCEIVARWDVLRLIAGATIVHVLAMQVSMLALDGLLDRARRDAAAISGTAPTPPDRR